MDEKDVEKTLSDALTKETGTKPDKIDCPGDLKGKIDTKMTCTLTSDTGEHDVALTVTKVDGLDIRFHYELADPTNDETASGPTLDKAQVEQKVSGMLEKQVGQRPDKIECPGDLPAKVGASLECTLTAGADELGVTATVTEVEDSTVNFHIEVDDQVG
ncbi:uncharacterized protein DUF4333 [Nocardioides albertanoniae]|uniref:Uncharacterized protein DUF4333 n=2 Tax=Nocardioides albertanoniae TaxID=1175486 RepID=A0A543A0W7_9ACTN|nr:uncharacterized protein DUF4333 [Nocardioides albertanoniae]